MSSGLQELLDLLAEPEVEDLPPELAPLPLTGTLTTENPTGLQASSECWNPVSKKLKFDSLPEKQESNKESLDGVMELGDEEVQFVNSFHNPLWDTDPIFVTHSKTALSSTKNESRPFSEKESPSSAVTTPGNHEKVLRLLGSESDRQFVGTHRIEQCKLFDGRGRSGFNEKVRDPSKK